MHRIVDIRAPLLPKGQPMIRNKFNGLTNQLTQTFGEISESGSVERFQTFSQNEHKSRRKSKQCQEGML